MGKFTGIQWCDSTVNPNTGCDGCELWELLEAIREIRKIKGGPCYAGNQHEGRLALAMPKLYARDFTEVRLAPGRMAKAASWPDLTGTDRPDKPWLNGMPRLIFVGDMGDVMSRAVPYEYFRDEVMGAVTSRQGTRHVWQVLTKRPKRLAAFLKRYCEETRESLPRNLWVGTSVTRRKTLGRIAELGEIPALIRFVSVEPLLERIDLSPLLWRRGYKTFEWLIVGGESDQKGRKGRPMEVEWADKVSCDCLVSRLPCFVKQLGSTPVLADGSVLSLRDGHGGDWDEWPTGLFSRDMPDWRMPDWRPGPGVAA